MDLNELGSISSIISLVVGLIFGFLGGRYSVRNKMKGNNIISNVDNRLGDIDQH